jgi:hypothetical protein
MKNDASICGLPIAQNQGQQKTIATAPKEIRLINL